MVSGSSSDAALPIQIFVNVPGTAGEDGPTPRAHMVVPEETWSLALQGSGSDYCNHFGNKPVDRRPISDFPFFC